jgi:cell division protease FtsH
MMGGRVAGKWCSVGKGDVGRGLDIEQATKLARMMVTRWGLSDKLGTVAYGENQDEVFLGYQVSRQQNISEETSRKIDGEIRHLVEAGYAEATQILTEKRADLEVLAKGLLEFETLTGDEISDLLAQATGARVGHRATRRAHRRCRRRKRHAQPPTGEVARSRRRNNHVLGDMAAEGWRAFVRQCRSNPASHLSANCLRRRHAGR